MDPVVHFEMPAKDKKRVADFYTKAFNWKMQQLGPEMSDYLMAATTETDEKGMIQTLGAINGGFYQEPQESGTTPPHIVISVTNLEESMKKVEEAGGKLLDKPMQIPTIGMFIMILDSEGNRVGLLQPEQM